MAKFFSACVRHRKRCGPAIVYGDARHHVYAVIAWQGGEPSNICDEHTELKWFGVSEMRGLTNLVDPDYVRLAELALEDKTS